ncbi:hypothetical protein [Methylococcus sp. EFPC2]|uniref:hypothetical protein n=1 Tax=Methylococcus sp. EFPC2 TaxID=2812648 RepID=UPI001967EBBE|nr:hypothetical protein [Methylococcus sp. EFPC2]QSA96649.1 hypothetical protein JWZ97_15755 [Methylococcus sp. EFPC2]
MPPQPHSRKHSPKRVGTRRILLAVVVCALIAAGWSWRTGTPIRTLYTVPSHIVLASLLKGWFYVGIIALLLYRLMRHWVQGHPAPSAAPPRGLPFVLLAVVVFALSGFAIGHTLMDRKETEVARLQAIADLKARLIADWLTERQNDAAFVQTSDFFSEQYRLWQEAGDTHAGERLTARLEQLGMSNGFAAITLLGPQGERLWGSSMAPPTLAPEVRAAAVAAHESVRLPPTGTRWASHAWTSSHRSKHPPTPSPSSSCT